MRKIQIINPVVVAVNSIEENGKNALPIAAAALMAY